MTREEPQSDEKSTVDASPVVLNLSAEEAVTAFDLFTTQAEMAAEGKNKDQYEAMAEKIRRQL